LNKPIEQHFTLPMDYPSIPEIKAEPSLQEPVKAYRDENERLKEIKSLQKAMKQAAKELDFIKAAAYRDKIQALEQLKPS